MVLSVAESTDHEIGRARTGGGESGKKRTFGRDREKSTGQAEPGGGSRELGGG